MIRATRRAALVAALLAAVACGGAASRSGYDSVLTQALEVDRGKNAISFTTDEAECTARRITTSIEDARLRELEVRAGTDLSTLPFTDEERGQVFDAIGHCVDLPAQVAATLERAGGLPADLARCVAERYTSDDLFEKALLSPALDEGMGDRVDAAIAGAVSACTTAD